MAVAAKTRRNALLGQVHAAAKEAGLDDALYREKLEAITGHRSAKDCTDDQLQTVIAAFVVKQNGNQPHTKFARALFIAAHNMGALQDGTDAALDVFTHRQTGKLRLAFTTPGEANKVAEALKDICARAGFAVPAHDAGGMDGRRALVKAQWQRLAALGAVMRFEDALDNYVSRKYLGCHASVINMTREQLDDCAKAFGRWIRKVQAQGAARPA
jgi:hypothetical protein